MTVESDLRDKAWQLYWNVTTGRTMYQANRNVAEQLYVALCAYDKAHPEIFHEHDWLTGNHAFQCACGAWEAESR